VPGLPAPHRDRSEFFCHKRYSGLKIEPISTSEGCTRLWKPEIQFDGIFEGLGVQPQIGDPYWAPPPKRSYQAEVGADPGRLRIAFTTKAWNFHEVDSECADAADEAAKLCEDLGHHVEEASPEINQVALSKAIGIIITAQTRALMQFAATVLGRQATSEDVEAVTWAYAEYARQFSASDYAEAINAVHRTGRIVGRFFTRYDIPLTPTMCTPPHGLER
jgi:amidase